MWEEKAKCSNQSELFFDTFHELDIDGKLNFINVFCGRCEVVKECGEAAQKFKPFDGVWGGELWKNGKPVKIGRKDRKNGRKSYSDH